MAAEVVNKELTDMDVQQRLSWPAQHLGRILPPGDREAYFVVVDNHGHPWSFKCKIRDGQHRKPVITGEWLDFVRTKGVRCGDRVVFCEHQDPRVHFSIRVLRPISPPLPTIW